METYWNLMQPAPPKTDRRVVEANHTACTAADYKQQSNCTCFTKHSLNNRCIEQRFDGMMCLYVDAKVVDRNE